MSEEATCHLSLVERRVVYSLRHLLLYRWELCPVYPNMAVFHGIDFISPMSLAENHGVAAKIWIASEVAGPGNETI